jgi:tRNA A58 N-methylase Trm61
MDIKDHWNLTRVEANAVACRNADALKGMSEKWQKDFDLVLLAVGKYWQAMKHAAPELKGNRKVRFHCPL